MSHCWPQGAWLCMCSATTASKQPAQRSFAMSAHVRSMPRIQQTRQYAAHRQHTCVLLVSVHLKHKKGHTSESRERTRTATTPPTRAHALTAATTTGCVQGCMRHVRPLRCHSCCSHDGACFSALQSHALNKSLAACAPGGHFCAPCSGSPTDSKGRSGPACLH